MTHLAERYGPDDMADWKVEVGQYRYYASGKDAEEYFFELFDHVYRTVKVTAADMEVSGSILSENSSLGDRLEVFLNHWYQREFKPDFLSMVIFA